MSTLMAKVPTLTLSSSSQNLFAYDLRVISLYSCHPVPDIRLHICLFLKHMYAIQMFIVNLAMPEQETMPDFVLMHLKYPLGLFHISTLFFVLIFFLFGCSR